MVNFIRVVIFLTWIAVTCSEQQENPKLDESCFCQLHGEIDDCTCKIENLDTFNNYKIFPRLRSLLQRDYFRYYKVNIFRKCPFGSDSSGKCGSKGCAVDNCKDEQIPEGLRKNQSKKNSKEEPDIGCQPEEKNELGNVNKEISEENKEAFKDWKKYDDAQDNFCELEDEYSPNAEYYDLVKNPERFTGYTGASAVNVWKLIYDQNCFKPDQRDYSYLGQQGESPSSTQGLCLEKRVFFRMISGFHTSINVDVTANWLLPATTAWGQPSWGPNLGEFRKRFDPDKTWGEGPKRLKNLYFAYLVEMRALAKAAPYLKQEDYYTGSEKEDREVQEAVEDLLEASCSFPDHFDERKLFKGDAKQLKEEFKVHFRNISHIMDCVGCDKCRLWGKLQITGMGTALKILFSGDSMGPESIVTQDHKKSKVPFQLTRGEIVALFNGIGRLSQSIHELDSFRRMIEKDEL